MTIVLGVDISKERLDYRFSDEDKSRSVENSHQGRLKLVKMLSKKGKSLVVFESTGGYERELAKVLEEKGVEYSIVNPLKIYHFRKMKGSTAKTDPIDARLICEYGVKMTPTPTRLRTEEREALWDLVNRRNQLVKMQTMEKNRRSSPIVSKRSKGSILSLKMALKAEIKACEKEMQALVNSVSELKVDYDILMSFKGIGLVSACTIISNLPECGKVGRETIAALVGVSPYDKSSGKMVRKSKIHGGRKVVRDTLYMATMSAINNNNLIRRHYRNLLSRGKDHKVAVIACSRKILLTLNAMLRDKKPWKETDFLVPIAAR